MSGYFFSNSNSNEFQGIEMNPLILFSIGSESSLKELTDDCSKAYVV